eukprot:TRINITY_DN508_c0_g1_i1.p1 TRINITY_DN508_c0_g1~~TRINITY_DN508_c0_g1_i1.p1  ORF type:complete len:100 (-),score=17.04 TRINITY_DN508_c0_g1_i1:63-362(-)
MSKGVMNDKDVSGGSWLRKADVSMSEKLGGYRAVQRDPSRELSAYGKYVEPALHAAEHTRRGVMYGNKAELARAADEVRSIGKGLPNADRKYQDQYQKK